MHPVNQTHETHGVYDHLVCNIHTFGSYNRRYLRMTNFDQIVALVSPPVRDDCTLLQAIASE